MRDRLKWVCVGVALGLMGIAWGGALVMVMWMWFVLLG